MTWGERVTDVCSDPAARIEFRLPVEATADGLQISGEIEEEALRIVREDPPKGPAHRWFPHVLRRASENVRRRRRWRERKASK